MRKTITFLKRSVGSISYLHTFNSKRGLYAFRLFAFIVAFLGFSANSAWGQTTYTFSGGPTGTSTALYTVANWSPSPTWGASTIAEFPANLAANLGGTNATAATLGVNFNSSNFNGNWSIGAINFLSTNKNITIGSSSTGGTLTLNGVTVNSVANTVIRHNGTSSLTLNAGSSGTMTIALANNTNNIIEIDNTGGITIATVISGTSKNLTKAGSGTGVLTLSGANTYSGTTTIAAGTLVLGVANAIPVAATGGGVILSGGNLFTGASSSATTAYSEGTISTNMGTLTLTNNSGITLANAIHSLYFANSSSVTWTSGKTLTITGWSGTAGATGTKGKIFIGNSASLTATQLSAISFNGYTNGTIQLSTGEIVPAGSPSIATPSPTSLSGFLTTSGTASSSQTFTVGGSNLTADLVVTAPTDYEVRENSIGSFGSSVSFTPSSGTVATKTIEVRIAAAASAGTPLGNIACTSTNATTKNVAVSGTVNAASSPVITASGTINAFANTAINATSADQSYTVEGSNLAGDIVITPPAGFQISTTSGLSFSPTNPITLAKDVSGNVSQTTIYVRFAPTAVQAYSGNITHASTDATTVNKALSGTGVYAEPTNQPVGLTAIANSSSQITVTWTDANGAQAPSAYIVKAAVNPSTPTAPVDGTAETAGTLVKIVTQGTQQAVFTGLSTSTTYNFSIWPYTNSGTAINYKTDGTVATASATTETPLGVPVATSATDVTTASFNANWNTAASATGYDVNVYTKSIDVAQNATSILTNPGTNNVNGTATQTGADGWTYTNISSSTSYIKMVKNGTGAAPSIISPTMNLTNYATLTYDMTGGTFGTVTGGLAALNLYVSTDNGNNWSSAIAITVSGSSESGAVTDVDLSAYVGNSQVIVKLEAPNATTGAGVRAKNITLTGKQNIITSTPITDSPFTVTATSKAVSGLNPATTYYYTVVAKKANETSSASNEISVTTDNHLSVSGDVNASTLPVCPTCDIEITNGNTLNINESKQFNSVTVAPGAKLTLENGFTLTAPITLQSNATGTATLLDSYATPTVTATVQQYVTAGRNWYVATPIQSSNVTEFGLGDSVVHFNETLKKWEKVTGALTAGRGYIQTAVNGHGSTGVVDFTGTTNSGDVTVSLTRSGTTQAGFNLVGNPYPSYLDWEAVAAANTDVLPTAWFRTKKADNSYVFATVNVADVTPVIVNNGANTTVTSYIPPMQAYWVRVDAGKASTNYTVSNSMRHHADDNGNKLKAPKSNSQQLLRLNVTGAGGSDEAVVYFSPKATNSLDRYDSPKMSNNNVAIPEIYTLAGAEKLVINGMGELNPSVELPLGFTTGQTNNFSISALELKNFASDIQVILKDKLQNTEFDLTSGQAYGFNSGVVNDASRFSIIFKTAGSVTGLDNKKLDTNTSVFVNANGELVVKTSALLGANARVDVFNAIGQHVGSKTMTSDMTISNVARTAGVYWVKLTNDGESITRKVVVK